MTVPQIIRAMKPVKPMSRNTLYNYIRRLKIKPLGRLRQRPVQYPEDTPQRIQLNLGLPTNGKHRRAA